MTSGTQTQPELQKLPSSAAPTGAQSVVVVNSGNGSAQFPDPNGGTLIFEAQGGDFTVVLHLNGFTYNLSPGGYALPPDPNNISLVWSVGGPSIKLAWSPR